MWAETSKNPFVYSSAVARSTQGGAAAPWLRHVLPEATNKRTNKQINKQTRFDCVISLEKQEAKQ